MQPAALSTARHTRQTAAGAPSSGRNRHAVAPPAARSGTPRRRGNRRARPHPAPVPPAPPRVQAPPVPAQAGRVRDCLTQCPLRGSARARTIPTAGDRARGGHPRAGGGYWTAGSVVSSITRRALRAAPCRSAGAGTACPRQNRRTVRHPPARSRRDRRRGNHPDRQYLSASAIDVAGVLDRVLRVHRAQAPRMLVRRPLRFLREHLPELPLRVGHVITQTSVVADAFRARATGRARRLTHVMGAVRPRGRRAWPHTQ